MRYMMQNYGTWGPHAGFGWDTGLPLFHVAFFLPLLLAFVLWSVGIKGYALWTAAKRGEKWWFIALLIINTVGLLEVFYLVFIAKKHFWKTSPDAPEKKS